jgi:hypothetical protein
MKTEWKSSRKLLKRVTTFVPPEIRALADSTKAVNLCYEQYNMHSTTCNTLSYSMYFAYTQRSYRLQVHGHVRM